MALPRFYIPPNQTDASVLSLPEREAHHARHVLRVQTGQSILLLDGQGTQWLCQITALGRHSVEVTRLKKETLPAPPWQITLVQAIPKTKSMEWIVQKATELGAARIVPLLTERVSVKIDPNRSKTDKWHWIAVEAMKQSGTAYLPILEPPVALGAYLARGDHADLALLGSLESRRHPRECFARFRQQHLRPPRTLKLWVGPEGDFTASELAQIEASGACPVSLGSQVLRSETAAFYCLAIAHYELQEHGQERS
jgi:16S rRNA (uracil1498-N3)-methyltransferase